MLAPVDGMDDVLSHGAVHGGSAFGRTDKGKGEFLFRISPPPLSPPGNISPALNYFPGGGGDLSPPPLPLKPPPGISPPFTLQRGGGSFYLPPPFTFGGRV